NIIVILADDLGYAEPGCQGGKDIPTPNIDSLAANGVRFTSGTVSCPVCSPTRAGLLTGRYQQRFGHEFNPGPAVSASDIFGLPLGEKTMADRLKALGYATGIVGKWHLGYNEAYTPTRRGFDEFFGFLGGAHPYFQYLNPDRKGGEGSIMRGTEPVEEKEYLTYAFAREAAAFIERHKGHPFFLYLSFNAVHAPLQATGKRLEKFNGIKDTTRRTFAAMLDAMDEGIGKVLKKLRELNLEENTLIVFLSDNGGPTLSTSSRNDPLNGFKGQVYEGGVRVPFIVQWKAKLPMGAVYDKPVISLDILPTAIAAAGALTTPQMNLDGVNLLPYLTGEAAGAPHEHLFWRFGGQSAVRSGNWKLARFETGDPMLFDLAEDIGEKNDHAAKNPDKLKKLLAAYNEWNAQNIAPLWVRKAEKRRRRKKTKKG
ncbi:MAG: sulfatase, partial [bacterium]